MKNRSLDIPKFSSFLINIHGKKDFFKKRAVIFGARSTTERFTNKV